MEPIRVYLDSDDYSKMSDPCVLKNEPEKQRIRDFLLKCVENNVIEIRFSMIHVVEMIQRNKEAKQYALNRARLLKDLTKGKTFRSFPNLRLDDAIYRAKASSQKMTHSAFPYYAFLDNYNWLDYDADSRQSNSVRSLVLKSVDQSIKSLKTSRENKIKLRRLFFKKGKLTSEAANLIKAGDIQFEQNSLESALIKFTSKEHIISWMMGEIKEKDYFVPLFTNTMDPYFFVDVMCDLKPECQALVIKFITSLGNDVLNRTIDVENKIEKIKIGFSINYPSLVDQLEGKLKIIYRNKIPAVVKNKRTEHLKKMYQCEKHKIRAAGLKWQDWENHVVNSDLGQLHSLDLFFVLQAQLYLDKVTGARAKVSTTDGPDIYHLGYSPYCDIFRADKRTTDMYNKIKRYTQIGDTKILSKIEELPDEIMKLAYERGVSKETIPDM